MTDFRIDFIWAVPAHPAGQGEKKEDLEPGHGALEPRNLPRESCLSLSPLFFFL